MIGSLGQVVVSLVDNIMVGDLGPTHLAAISLSNSVLFIALSVGMGFSFAITPLIAEAEGEGDIKKGRNLFHQGVFLCIIIGLLLFVGLIYFETILGYLNQDEEVIALALPYYRIVIWSMVPMMIFQSIKQFADGLSETKHAMRATIMANVLNVILNYLLIYGTFGFPRLELEGAAIGSLIARVFMILVLWLFIRKRKVFKPYLQKIKEFKIHKETINKLLTIGYPTSLQMLFEMGFFASCVMLAGVLSVNDQASNQIALNLSSMTYMVGVGLGVTASIRIGNYKGAKDYKGLKRIAISILLLTFVIEILFAAGFILAKDFLPTIYIDNLEVIQTASVLLVIAAIFQLSDGIQVVVLGALRGLQDVKKPMYITFFAYWVIGFPTSYYLGLHTYLGAEGIWIGLLVGLTVSAVLLYIRFHKLSNKLIKENK